MDTQRVTFPLPIQQVQDTNATELWTESLKLETGSMFKQYVVKGQLRVSSAQADMWLLQPERNDAQKYVLKLYRPGITPPQLITLKHPNLLTPIEQGNHVGRFYEITPYCPLGSFGKYLITPPKNWTTFVKVADQLLSALQYLQDHQIQHRDIKPDNILVRAIDPLELVLADFGSSANAATTVLTGAQGTLLYASPESLQGTYTAASDVYSLGMVLLHWVLGTHPLLTSSRS